MNALRRQAEARLKKIVDKLTAGGRFSQSKDKHWEKRATRCPTCKTKFSAFRPKQNCSICGKIYCKSCVPPRHLIEADEHVNVCRSCQKYTETISNAVQRRKKKEYDASTTLSSLWRGIVARKIAMRLSLERERRRAEDRERRRLAECLRRKNEATLNRLRSAKLCKEFSLIVAILHRNFENASIVERCCDAIAGLACSPQNKFDIRKTGCIESVFKAIREFPGDVRVQESAAIALMNTMHCSEENKEACVEAGCVHVLLEAGERHPDSTILEGVLRVLREDFDALRHHPTSESLRCLGRETTELFQKTRDRYSLERYFCGDAKSTASELARVQIISAQDVIACRRYFESLGEISMDGVLLQLLKRPCTRRQEHEIISFASKARRKVPRSNRDAIDFDQAEFIRRVTQKGAPVWARLFLLRVLEHEGRR